MFDSEERLSALESRMQECCGEDSSDFEDEDYKRREQEFLDILKSYCEVVRDAEAASGASDLESIIKRVEELFSKALEFAYGDSELFEYVPSFAHTADSSSILTDKLGEGIFSSNLLESVMPLLLQMFGPQGFDKSRLPKPPPSWRKTLHPHPSTTLCSRFRDDIPTWNDTDSNPRATAVYQARCEMFSDTMTSPIELLLSSKGSCMTILAAGGYKDRTPVLFYYLPPETGDSSDFPEQRHVEMGLANIAYHSTTDEDRKLMFAGDDARVKSYAWGSLGEDARNYRKPLPKHTLDSKKWDGPMVVLPNGRFIRAGKGSVGIWNLDSMETHGPKGNKRVGARIKTEDTWRDDPEEIEGSKGSPANSKVTFEEADFAPAKWHPHPSQVGAMLCGTEPQNTNKFYCRALDLESGKTIIRYLGHGGTIESLSTSAGDPNVFVSACSDGYARLYDVRHPLPVMTFDGTKRSQSCPAAVLAHPDGYPFIFTGTESSEHILMWDVRRRAPIFDLATGNNAVSGLAWDATYNTLYATTECRYVDRNGRHHEYRRARVPAPPNENNDTDSEDEDEDDEDDNVCWPKKAYHSENYYGHCFDAGDHMLYRYVFKQDADTQFAPAFGSASVDSDTFFGW